MTPLEPRTWPLNLNAAVPSSDNTARHHRSTGMTWQSSDIHDASESSSKNQLHRYGIENHEWSNANCFDYSAGGVAHLEGIILECVWRGILAFRASWISTRELYTSSSVLFEDSDYHLMASKLDLGTPTANFQSLNLSILIWAASLRTTGKGRGFDNQSERVEEWS